MRFIILRDVLFQALSITNKIVPSSSSNPALLSNLIRVSLKGLEIQATDGTISAKLSIPLKDEKDNVNLEVMEEGDFLVSAKCLFDMIYKFDTKKITFNMVDSNYLSVYDSSTSFNIYTRDSKDFPILGFDLSEDNNSFKAKISDIKKLFDKTSFAVATKGSKDMFLGIDITARNGKLYFLATDSYRMARYAIKSESESAKFDFICPVKALSIISSLTEDKEVKVIFDNQRSIFKTDDLIIATRLYQGEFPSPDRIIPSSFAYSISFNTENFLKSIDKVRILAAYETKTPICKLTISKETGVTLSSHSEGNGECKDILKDCEIMMPENEEVFEIGFNIEYVCQSIKALGSEKSTLVFSSPVRMFMAKNDDEENIQILTPVRISR